MHGVIHTDNSWEFWEDVSRNHNNSGLLHIDPKHMESTDGQKKNRWDFDSVCPIRICRTMVGRCDAMSLFFMFSFETLNIHEQMGKLRTERRYDPQFRGPTFPFGSEIFNPPISTRDESKLRQISSEVLEVCLSDVLWTESAAGQAWHTPKEWKTTLHQTSTSKDSKIKKWDFKSWRTIFRVATVQKRQEGPHRHTLQPGSILFDFGWRYQCMPSRRRSISGSYFVATSCLNREKYMRAKAQTCYQRNWDEYLDIEQEHIINNHWHVDSERPQSRSWIGLTIFTVLKTPPPDGHLRAGERLTEIRATFWAWWHQARGMVENV